MEHTIKLNKKSEFEAVLHNYHVSDHAQKVLGNTHIVLLVGLAGGGRNTIINYLVKSGHYHYLVSDTTRPPKMRDGVMEENGVQYFFRSEDDILDDLKAGEFLEAEIIHNQQVSGISIRELEKANNAHKIVINEVEIGGAQNVLGLKKDTQVLFIIPPSYSEWQRRFRGREDIHAEEYKNRIVTAERNLRVGLDDDRFVFVVNDSLEHAVRAVDEIVRLKNFSHEKQVAARQTAQHLYEAVKEELALL